MWHRREPQARPAKHTDTQVTSAANSHHVGRARRMIAAIRTGPTRASSRTPPRCVCARTSGAALPSIVFDASIRPAHGSRDDI